MKRNGLDGDTQKEGNFFARAALGDQLQNLPLPRAEAKSCCGTGRIREPLQVFARKTRSYIDMAVQNALDSVKKLFARGRFQYVSSPSRVERGLQVRGVYVHRYE